MGHLKKKISKNGNTRVVEISCDIHLDLLHSESWYMHKQTRIVLSAELSGIQCESKHIVPP